MPSKLSAVTMRMLSIRLVAGILFAAMTVKPSFCSMAPHDIAQVDWNQAIAAYKELGGRNLEDLRAIKAIGSSIAAEKARLAAAGFDSEDLATINAVSSLFRPDISAAGAPVLLPFNFAIVDRNVIDTGAVGTAAVPPLAFRRLRPLGFYPGAYGYRAYFRLEGTSSVVVSGSTIFYRLPGAPSLPTLKTCVSLIEEARRTDKTSTADFFRNLRNYDTKIGVVAAEYFGDREAAIPCLFSGALIEVHILCDSYGDPDCKIKDVARDIVASLNFVGGSPVARDHAAAPDPVISLDTMIEGEKAALAKLAPEALPHYGKPGDLATNSGVRAKAGSPDFGLYGSIVFPTDLSAVAQSVVYREDQNCLVGDRDLGSSCRTPAGLPVKKVAIGEWVDNFCEARSGNNLPTCPVGHGHAGQDIWGKGWNSDTLEHPLRAAVDGVAFRRFPAQPAVTISDVHATNIDYIYRHMRPSALDRNGIVASTPRPVRRGCLLALVDKLQGVSMTPSKLVDGRISYIATARHLHFEIRVPTAAGYQNVSPYQTVVWAHQMTVTKLDALPATTDSCLDK